MTQVAIVGAGPAGKLAAWAAVDAGYEPVIFDKNPYQMEKTAGVFGLHCPCNLPLRSVKAMILPSGTKAPHQFEELYRDKVYGVDAIASEETSVPTVPQAQTFYDAEQAMHLLDDILWPFYKQQYLDWRDVLNLCDHYPHVVNTAPLDYLLHETLPCLHLWVYTGQAKDHEAYLLYNVNPYIKWYRASALFGQFTLEFVPGWEPDEEVCSESWHKVRKVLPLAEEFSRPENLLLTGRFGAWDKSKMAHHAYHDVRSWLP